MVARWVVRRTVQITVGRQRWFRRRLINLMGDYRVYQIGGGQRAVRRWSHSHSWLHWPFHSFIDKIVVLPATFILLLESQALSVSLALLSITLFTLFSFPFPLSLALTFPLPFPFSFSFQLSLAFPLGHDRPLPLLFDLHTFAFNPFPIVHLHLLLFPIGYNRWMLH